MIELLIGFSTGFVLGFVAALRYVDHLFKKAFKEVT